MITSITFQFKLNKNYKNTILQDKSILGEATTGDMQTALWHFHIQLGKAHDLVAELNQDPTISTTDIKNKIFRVFGREPLIVERTKRKRTYLIGYLIIHQEDSK